MNAINKIISFIIFKFNKKVNIFKIFILDLKAKKYKNKIIKNPSDKIKQQLNNSLSIPVIIINYNQLFYLKKLISFFKINGNEKIIIIDNKSTYQPLLDYYKTIENDVEILMQNENHGHLVFWKNKEIYNRFSDGFFIITDSDIVPNNNLEANYINEMLTYLYKYKDKTKVGFSLKIDDIPDYYSLKENVINWESKFWENEIEKDVFEADIDTTFALYWPKTNRLVNLLYPSFFNAIRLGGKFTAQHGGWYLDHNNLSEEQVFYYKTANTSNSWKIDNEGKLDGNFKNDY